MPTSIQVPGGGGGSPKASTLDNILKGLQVAQTGFGIAVDLQKFQGQGTENELKQQELATKQRQESGTLIPSELAKIGTLVPIKPQAPALTPLGGGQQSPHASPTSLLPKPQLAEAISPLSPLAPKGKLKLKLGDDIQEVEYRSPDANKEALDLATKLRAENQSHPITKRTDAVADSYASVVASEDTPAGKVALVYGYMKMLDPSSAVREGEIATINNSGGVPSWLRSLYNDVTGTGKLDPKLIPQIKQQAAKTYEAQLNRQRSVDDYSSKLAKRYGLDPQEVVMDRPRPAFQKSPEKKGAPKEEKASSNGSPDYRNRSIEELQELVKKRGLK